jgi:S-adenosyl-L-methionine hydrolase (adenosine-forming)
MPTVFFLSDYGTQDEFVGVVHAVLHAASPGLTIIDLTHQIPAFDVRAGADALSRAVPHLGAGVVLAVIDPGVGSERRGVCLQVRPGRSPRPTFFVGPDNGLLVGAAESAGAGPVARAFALRRSEEVGARTFDGRDLFAPAAAALCRGTRPEELGDPIEPQSLVRLARRQVAFEQLPDGRRSLRVEVSWVDRFGNVQLAVTATEAQSGELPAQGRLELAAGVGQQSSVRRVGVFAELAPGELGLLVDGNGHVAVVAGEASAAHALGLHVGEIVRLTW